MSSLVTSGYTIAYIAYKAQIELPKNKMKG